MSVLPGSIIDMRKERVFSRNGFYRFVLDSNLMLHKHVAAAGHRYLSKWIGLRPQEEPLKVLDLACGGAPVSICNMIAGFPDRTFHYTGIDINPDQVEEATTRFVFPANIASVKVMEGDAWDLTRLSQDNRYDIIFTGMNIHHGTPEEIYCLLLQCKNKLSDGGVFLNHDLYRPPNQPYLRRPQFNPTNSTESFEMISKDVIERFKPPAFDLSESDHTSTCDWRSSFVQRYQTALQEREAPEQGIHEVFSHVLARDFPVSTAEMRLIAGTVGFELDLVPLDAAAEPLYEYYALVAARPH